jgi:YebC/PmpR family DNA-binding regulatory protein
MWTKLIREVIVAVRMGGPEPEMNPRLRLALLKCRGANVPKDTLKNAILKGSGKLEGVNYEEIRYEGYGIGGAALMIDCTTDNKTRTVADVRHVLSKAGGNLGTDGSVSFMFKRLGFFLFAPGLTEDEVMEVAIEAGADDVQTNEDGSIEVTCDPMQFEEVLKAFNDKGWEPEVSEVTWKSDSETVLTGEDGEKMQRLLDALEDLDDVSQVYTTAVIE